jgi:DNA-binding Lrp family transcriptional regulator
MDPKDKKLLTSIQVGLPLVPKPFQVLGAGLGFSESEVISRLTALKSEGILRQLSAIFDTKALGYISTLVAAKYPPERLVPSALFINQHPGVSHNYERDHAFNLWYTIAVPPDESLEDTVAGLAQRTQALSTRMLPTLRLFKIGVKLDLTGEGTSGGEFYDEAKQAGAKGYRLTPEDIALVRELQEDLDIIPEPFNGMAKRLSCSVESLLNQAQALKEAGVMRRFAGILRHERAGFKANAMGVWVVPEDKIEQAGKTMTSFSEVSHCYQRPTYPDWPYSLFTMIHARAREECQAIAGRISEVTGIREYALLRSLREFKKTRVKYFIP